MSPVCARAASITYVSKLRRMNATERNSQPQLLTAEQLAERWQVPKSHVYRLAREGKIPTVALGRYRRFRLDAIEAFELAREVKP
jgi:excisionase family DNA binding protein